MWCCATRQSGELTAAVARGIDHQHHRRRLLPDQPGHRQPGGDHRPARADHRTPRPTRAFRPWKACMHYNLRAILCAPLIIRGQVIGVVYVDNRLRSGLFRPATSICWSTWPTRRPSPSRTPGCSAIWRTCSPVSPAAWSRLMSTGGSPPFNRAAAAHLRPPARGRHGPPYSDVFGLLAKLAGAGAVRPGARDGRTGPGPRGQRAVPGRRQVDAPAQPGPRRRPKPASSWASSWCWRTSPSGGAWSATSRPTVVEHLVASAPRAQAGRRAARDHRPVRRCAGLYHPVRAHARRKTLIDLLNAHLSLAGSTIMDPSLRRARWTSTSATR